MKLLEAAAELRAAAAALEASHAELVAPGGGVTIESALQTVRAANDGDYVVVRSEHSRYHTGESREGKWTVWDGKTCQNYDAPTLAEAVGKAVAGIAAMNESAKFENHPDDDVLAAIAVRPDVEACERMAAAMGTTVGECEKAAERDAAEHATA